MGSFPSERMHFRIEVLHIGKLVVGIAMINHFIACVWRAPYCRVVHWSPGKAGPAGRWKVHVWDSTVWALD